MTDDKAMEAAWARYASGTPYGRGDFEAGWKAARSLPPSEAQVEAAAKVLLDARWLPYLAHDYRDDVRTALRAALSVEGDVQTPVRDDDPPASPSEPVSDA